MDQRVFASTCEQQRGSKIEWMNCVRERGRSSTVGLGEDGRCGGRRRSWCSSGGGLPAASNTHSVDRCGSGWEDTVLSWCACLYSPHLLYIVPVRSGPTTQLGWASPTREPSQGPDSIVGPNLWISILTKKKGSFKAYLDKHTLFRYMWVEVENKLLSTLISLNTYCPCLERIFMFPKKTLVVSILAQFKFWVTFVVAP